MLVPGRIGAFSRQLGQTRFGRSAMVLVSMTALAQIIPLAISPILTRLFSPDDFGVLALYLAGIMVASITAAGRYDLAVMLAPEEEDAEALVLLSCGISVMSGLAGTAAIAIWGREISLLLGRPDLGPWLYVMPAGLGLIGTYNALMQWLNRRGAYRKMGANRILQTGLTGLVTIALGLAGLAYPALLIGALFGLGITTGMLGLDFALARRRSPRKGVGMRLRAMAGAYRNFPLHVLPGQCIGVLAMQLPVFIVMAGFGAATAGLYHLAYRVIAVPGSLIGAALGDVYRQHAAEAHRAQGHFDKLFLKTIGLSFVSGLPALAVLLAFAPALFAFVFGEPWRAAGEYARIMSVAAFVQFVCLPVDKSAMITGRTGYILGWNIAMAAAVALLGGLVAVKGMTFETFLMAYTAILVVMYAGDSVAQYFFSRSPRATREAVL